MNGIFAIIPLLFLHHFACFCFRVYHFKYSFLIQATSGIPRSASKMSIEPRTTGAAVDVWLSAGGQGSALSFDVEVEDG